MRKYISLFLLLVVAGAAQTSSPASQPAPQASAQPAPQKPAEIKKLAEGVYASINPDGGRAGSNAGFVVGDDGVLVVDTQVSEAAARDLLAEIRKVTQAPIRFVVNTHYHLDHTGGNAVFQKEGAVIVAHQNVRKWLRTENMKFFPNPTPEQKARVEALALPQLTLGKDAFITLWVGSRPVVVHTLLGHTGSDSAVLVPDAHVLFGGDLLWNARFPNLIDATTDAWIKTLDMGLAAHPDATFVPGHGDVGNAEFVRVFRNYLSDLRTAVGEARAAGKSGDELVAAVQPGLAEKYKSFAFQRFLPLNIQQTAAELEGKKKVPQP
jgi:glyoxylase-like metal-dependent hydrolase (beta-lactamase superfamily II)